MSKQLDLASCPHRHNVRIGERHELADCGLAAIQLPQVGGRPPTINAGACAHCLNGGWPDVKESLRLNMLHAGKPYDEPGEPPSRLRVGWLLPVWAWGGMERWLHSTLSYIDHRRIAVSGIWLQFGKPRDKRLLAELDAMPPIYSSLAALARHSDIIVASGIRQVPTDLPRDLPVVVVSHGSASWTREIVAAWRQRATAIVAVSAVAATVAPPGVTADVVHNGVDLLRVADGDREAYRRLAGIPLTAKVLGYVGRLVPEKGIRSIIEALALLPQEWHALLVGTGSDEQGCRVLAAQLGVSHRVHLPGPTLEVRDAYAATDVFAYPSAHEGFALSLIEAWVNGLPCIATEVGAIAEAEAMMRCQLAERVTWPPQAAKLADAVLYAFTNDTPARQHERKAAASLFSAAASAAAWTDYLLDLAATLPPRNQASQPPKVSGGCGSCGSK